MKLSFWKIDGWWNFYELLLEYYSKFFAIKQNYGLTF